MPYLISRWTFVTTVRRPATVDGCTLPPCLSFSSNREHVFARIPDENGHFFKNYRSVEPGQFSEITGWRDRLEAGTAIEQCTQRSMER